MEQVMRIEDVEGELQFHELGGEYCLTTEQIAKGLGYSNPDHVNTLIQRNIDDIEPYRFSDTVSENPKGGRPGYLYTEEGVYIISMFAQTQKAKEFRKKIAKILKMLRQRKMDNLKVEFVEVQGKYIALLESNVALLEQLRRKPTRKITEDERKRIWELHQQGVGVNEIARILGRSKASVSNVLNYGNTSGRQAIAQQSQDVKS